MGDKMVFFISAFVALVCAAFLFANSENSNAKKAQDLAHSALNNYEKQQIEIANLREDVDQLYASYKSLIDTMLSNDSHGEKLKQKMIKKKELVKLKNNLNCKKLSSEQKRM